MDLCNSIRFKEVTILIRAKYEDRATSSDDDPLSNIRFVMVKDMGETG